MSREEIKNFNRLLELHDPQAEDLCSSLHNKTSIKLPSHFIIPNPSVSQKVFLERLDQILLNNCLPEHNHVKFDSICYN